MFRRDAWLCYGLAFLTFAIALTLRLELQGSLPPGFPYLTFFPAVIVTTFIAGLWPGILCAILSGVAAWFFFLPPFNSFALSGANFLALAFYIFIVTVDIALIHFMHRSADRLRASEAVSARLYDQQRTMFQELQHRVANNMTFVASLLHLQKRKVEADPGSAIGALDEAQRRIEIMSRVHRKLYDPASVDLPVAQYFQEICADLLQATGAKNIVCMIDMPEIKLDIARLMTLSLLVTELVTNCLKHAFDEGGGTITLTLERLGPEHLALTVSDTGCGLPEGAGQATGSGLGTRIVNGLAAQLGGEVKPVSGPSSGAAWRTVFQA